MKDKIKQLIKDTLPILLNFFGQKKNRRLSYLVLIGLIAMIEFLNAGMAKRTFIFYSNIGNNIVVEDRMLRRSRVRETDIRRYVDEVLLGPVSPNSALLFPRETRLESLMYRGGVVYASLSEIAALPVPEGRDVFLSLLTLNEGIRRNFSYVKDVRLFIGGNEVFFEEFRGIFANYADNSKTSP
ncbi:MAG: hypothetical protein FWH19_00765 [Treponema sp.]|nr:hypothetical protein [Treponema sp.]